jgi:hypothetical protein
MVRLLLFIALVVMRVIDMYIARHPRFMRHLTSNTKGAIALAMGKENELCMIRRPGDNVVEIAEGDSGLIKRNFPMGCSIQNIDVSQDGHILLASADVEDGGIFVCTSRGTILHGIF